MRKSSVIIMVIGLVILAVATSLMLPDPKNTRPNKSDSDSRIVVEGKLACLPHASSSGPQTMECAMGIKTAGGDYYGLRTDDPIIGSSTGDKLRVTGSLESAANSNYDSQGIITATKIEKL